MPYSIKFGSMEGMDSITSFDLFVPGRVCLFGEHSDWAGGYRRINSQIEKGYAIITGINQGIHARVTPHSDLLIYRGKRNGQVLEYEVPMQEEQLLEVAKRGEYFSYIAGVAYQILTHYHVGGLVIDNYKTDLPIQKGLSSSAAISVLTARGFNRVYDLKMTVRGEMDLAYRGEITTPSRCGRMDQGCAYGVRPILMTFDGDAIDVEEIALKEDLYLVLVDLKAEKDTKKILRDLNKAYPFPDNEVQVEVQGYLGKTNRELVNQAKGALESQGPEIIGRLMEKAQDHFDKALIPACPDELTAPVLHKLLGNETIGDLHYGGKGVGSQGDGTAQFVVKDAESQSRLIDLLKEEFSMEGLPVFLRKTRKLRKAVITAAGLGTRLFPMTKVLRKEFMPVLSGDGRVEPLLIKTVREVLEAGIEKICLVIQEEELPTFKEVFSSPVSPEVFQKLDSLGQEYCKRLEAYGERIEFCFQRKQEGLGHALLETENWVGEDPFLFVLGDHYFTSSVQESCTQQFLEWYEELERPLIALAETPLSQIHRFGTIAGEWEKEGELLWVSEVKEKPSQEYASLHLPVVCNGVEKYYTVFGEYILNNQIFTILHEMVNDNVREQGEIQLTAALEELRRKEGLRGIVMKGEKIDIGIPSEYRRVLSS